MSLQKEYESYLAHYGVPGMKWGVRKEQYKSMTRMQKKSLKALGEYAQSYNRHQKRLAKGKKLSARQIRQDEAYKSVKKGLERVLKVKINDKSLADSRLKGALAIMALSGGSALAMNIISSKRQALFNKMDLAAFLDEQAGLQ